MNGVSRQLAALPAIAAILIVATGLSIAQQPKGKKGKKKSVAKKAPTRKKRSVSRPRLANTALVGGYIISQSSKGNFVGNIIIRNGRITDVGPKAVVPKGISRIDATGTIITPGFIDAQSSLWITPKSRNEKSTTGSLNILDGVDQFAEDWREVVRHGVTAIYVQPKGVYGGNGALLRVGSGNRTSQLFLKPVAAIQGSLGVESGSGSSHYTTIKSALAAAKKGAKRRLNPLTKTRNHGRILARMVLGRRAPLLIEAHKSNDILNAFKLADEFKARLILSGVSEPGEALEKIQQRRVALVVGPLVEMEGTAPSYRRNRKAKWLQSLLKENPKWCLGTFSNHIRGSKFLRVQAAAATAAGLSPQRVLQAITIDAATILGIDKQIGSIQKGKYADLVSFIGDPLDPGSPVHMAFAKGELVYASRKARRRGRLKRLTYRNLPAKLPTSYAVKSRRFLSSGGVASAKTMVVQNGAITAIGSSVTVPSGLPTYDLGNAVVTAGLVAAETTLNLSADTDGSTGADELHVQATDGFDPNNSRAKTLAQAGFLSLGFGPSSKNVVAGSVGVVRPAAQPCVLSSRIASKFVLTSAARNRSRFPASLSGQTLMVSGTLRGNGAYTNVFLPPPILRQLRRDRAQVVTALRSRQQVALFEASNRAEVLGALRTIERHKLRAAISGAVDVRPFVSTIRRLRVGLVIPPISAALYDRMAIQFVALANSGVPIGFSAGNGQHLRASVAIFVRLGMKRSVALAALSSGAARTMGMPSWVGRLTKGGRADFVVWTGSPLDMGSRPVSVVCDGKPVSLK